MRCIVNVDPRIKHDHKGLNNSKKRIVDRQNGARRRKSSGAPRSDLDGDIFSALETRIARVGEQVPRSICGIDVDDASATDLDAARART